MWYSNWMIHKNKENSHLLVIYLLEYDDLVFQMLLVGWVQ